MRTHISERDYALERSGLRIHVSAVNIRFARYPGVPDLAAWATAYDLPEVTNAPQKNGCVLW